MKTLLKSLKALADGNRLRILRLLMDRPRCVCELQAVLGIAQPSVSNHLRILEEAELVEKHRQGQFIEYQLNTGLNFAEHQTALLALIGPQLKASPELTALCQRARDVHRQDLCRPEVKPMRSLPDERLTPGAAAEPDP